MLVISGESDRINVKLFLRYGQMFVENANMQRRNKASEKRCRKRKGGIEYERAYG